MPGGQFFLIFKSHFGGGWEGTYFCRSITQQKSTDYASQEATLSDYPI